MMIRVIRNPSPGNWEKLCRRPLSEGDRLRGRVGRVIGRVKRFGDRALLDYTRRFDGVRLRSPEVGSEWIEASGRALSMDLKRAISLASENIRTFHASQRREYGWVETSPGVRCRIREVPVEKVGLYIPGGSAPLFSSVLMLAIPAVLAGCSEVILCTPPAADGTVHPAILYAARQSGVSGIFAVGGAQAIAAMAYGTESVPRVYKIFGPGNQYVTMAKQLVAMDGIAIDLPAGPSELAVMADNTANPAFVAADILSQAEHGPDSQVVLVTTDASLPGRVISEMEKQLDSLPRKNIASRALKNSMAVILDDLPRMISFINLYAPEHLIVMTENHLQVSDGIVNAGSVFLGQYSPESAGDYASGTNHTLPTNAAARAWSGVSLDSFCKKISYQEISPAGLKNLGPAIESMADAEQLLAHKQAVSLRLKSLP